MNISLTKFCNDNGLSKTTVHRRCQELGIDTSNGLSPEAVNTLSNEFNVTPQPVKTAVTVDSPIGNIVLANPTLPSTYSLQSLRTSEAITIADPLAAAQEFLQVAEGLTVAMQQDIATREEELRRTRQAKAAVVAKAQELKLEARLYQETARQVDLALSSETQDLQQTLGQLQALGKPQESAA